jgi:aspartate aminotransferase/aminotransferase
MLSKRIQKIEESGIRKVFNLVSENPKEYINLSIGRPHFDTHEKLKEAAKKAIDEGKNQYSTTLGIDGLRRKISEKLENENEIKSSIENVMITSGVAGGFFLAASACFDPGDEVIISDPYFILHKQVFNFLGVKCVSLDTYDDDFHIDVSKLEKLVTPRTRGIVLNSPNNPTGVVYSKEELEGVANVASLHDLMIISDEIYEKFDFENKFFSIGSIYEKTITLGGFSKSHFVTGWRVGFLHAPKELIQVMNNLQQYTFVCAPTPFQFAIEEGFEVSIESEVEEYEKNAKLVYEKLKGNFEIVKPEGAFYAFVKKPEGRDDFVEELLEKGVVVVSGDSFSLRDDHFRISFAVDRKDLEKGLSIMCDLVRK